MSQNVPPMIKRAHAAGALAVLQAYNVSPTQTSRLLRHYGQTLEKRAAWAQESINQILNWAQGQARS